MQTLEAKCYANVDEKRKCCEKKFIQGSDFFTKISSFYNFCNLLKAKLDTLYSDSDTRVSFVQNSWEFHSKRVSYFAEAGRFLWINIFCHGWPESLPNLYDCVHATFIFCFASSNNFYCKILFTLSSCKFAEQFHKLAVIVTVIVTPTPTLQSVKKN